jgi:hypothetical protein
MNHKRDVRFWHLADLRGPPSMSAFGGKTDIAIHELRLLMTQNGHFRGENSLRRLIFSPGQLRARPYRNAHFPVKLLAIEK